MPEALIQGEIAYLLHYDGAAFHANYPSLARLVQSQLGGFCQDFLLEDVDFDV